MNNKIALLGSSLDGKTAACNVPMNISFVIFATSNIFPAIFFILKSETFLLFFLSGSVAFTNDSCEEGEMQWN